MAAFSCAVRSGAVLTGVFCPFKASSSIRKKPDRGTLAANPLRGGVAHLLALQARSSRGLYRFPTQLPSGVLYAPKGAAAPLFFTRVCVCVCVYRVRVHQPRQTSESPRLFVGVCLKHAPSGAYRLVCSDFCVWFCGAAPFSARRRQT